jgi:O-antigen/teichoic acid export membrane protein
VDAEIVLGFNYMKPQRLNAALYSSIKSSVLAKYVGYLASLVSLAIMARAFSPDDFGKVAAITAVIMFFTLLIEAVTPAIISLDKISKKDEGSLITFTLFIGVVFATILLLSKEQLAIFYGDPDLDVVTIYLTLGFIIYCSMIVPIALLQRDKKFYVISFCTALGELGGSGVALIALSVIPAIEALLLKFIAGPLFSVNALMFYWFWDKKYIPLPTLNLTSIQRIKSFIKYQLAFNVVNYIIRLGDNIIVGKFFGTTDLAIYEKSYQLMRYPMYLLTYAIGPAIQPVITSADASHEEIWTSHIKILTRLLLISTFLTMILLITADLLVLIILGPTWTSVAELLRLLCFSIPAQIILSTTNGFVLGLKMPNIQLYTGMISAVFVISAVAVGVTTSNLQLLCIALSISFQAILFPFYFIVATKVFKRSPAAIYGKILPLMLLSNIALYTTYSLTLYMRDVV